jgi:hypothetical protein
MQLVATINFGPFRTDYHRDLVDSTFQHQLECFLQQQLVPQLDAALHEFQGTLRAKFDDEMYCGPRSLVRDIFTLECIAVCDDGTSSLKSDIVYDPVHGSFAPRTSHSQFFYVWTPARIRMNRDELAAIQRVIDSVHRGEVIELACPLCGGPLTAVNDSRFFDVRCQGQRCFVRNYHKDEDGGLAHGHFIKKHPLERTG